MKQNMQGINWGIAATGGIAQKFSEDLRLVDGAIRYAVGSRTIESARSFAGTYGFEKAYGSYDELFADPQVDIVYIATPHDSHAELSIRAMEMGKHVLCEKPMAVNEPQVRLMVDVADQNNVFLMEGLWTRFHPAVIEVMELVKKGEIGDLVYLNADFAFYLIDRPKDRILNPHLAGGALLDIGIYPVFLSYLLLGVPERVEALAQFHEKGVDIQNSMIFDYNSSLASLSSSFITESDMVAKIYGRDGAIFLNPYWHSPDGYTLIKNGRQQVFEHPIKGNGFSYEIEECHRCVEKNAKESERWSLNDSLSLIQLLDQIRQKIGLKYPFEQ